MENIKQEIQKIKERNQKVEVDKAWETSWTRRALLALFTYLAIGAYMWAIDIPRPWLNSVVPTVAFMLSTLTMPFFKKLWARRQSAQTSKRDIIDEQESEKQKNMEKLRGLIQNKDRITNDEVESFLSVSNATAERYLNELEKEGLIGQVGDIGQDVFYKVKKPNNSS